jgi:mono/diheme cytochrome c family protein
MSRALRRWAAVLALPVVVLAALAAWPWLDRAPDLRGTPPPPADAATLERGAYLARLGNCTGCHSTPGGAPYAGGRRLSTPFGTVVAANLTPDPQTGLGRWTAEAFRRALADGRSADGRPLLPGCPYPNLGLIGARDADDLFAHLRSQAPQRHAVPAHELHGAYAWPQALLAWRAAYFRRAELPAAPPAARADWSRGAWLVGGPGHCSACHGRRNAWGANDGAFDLRGGTVPTSGWIAPSLLDPRAASVAGWSEDEVVALLRDGRNRHATVSGPMATVVAHSLQHWREADLRAAAEFLRRLPPPDRPSAPPAAAAPPAQAVLLRGERLYADHCADCHGPNGEGVADDGPALAGNRALALDSPVNVLRIVLGGGFGPSTRGQPRPPGMPPFATLLGDDELAAVVSFVRWRHGAQASAVDALDVNRQR